jgi:hypothetical protein
MGKKHAHKRVELHLGPLPVDMLNRTLSLDLEPGDVVLSTAAQVHAQRRHPAEYPVCLPHLAQIIATPRYVGDDFRKSGKIELIGYARTAGSLVLVAVSIETDDKGRYHLRSFYPISDDKANARREKGFLRIPKS